jgi:WD40 repeat protein
MRKDSVVFGFNFSLSGPGFWLFQQPARRLLIAAVLLLAGRVLDAASLVDPALHFKTLRTAHFVIYFHQGEAAIADRLATIAEDTWRQLQQPLGTLPPRRTHVILVDQTEAANGFATPVPYDTVLVTAVWPAGSDFIGNTEDWLRLAFTHEFTHIVHLDRSEGWARFVRGVFGRTEVAFPNLFLPAWQIEGLAAYEESVITGEGRLHAGDFRAVTTEAARAGRLEPLDRANGGLIDWPDGQAQYAYGVGFHAWLAEQYGAARFADLARATARRVPYTASRVFERIYGKSLGALWKDYEASVARAAPPAAPLDPVTRLTTDGFVVSGPRFLSPTEIAYAVRTPHAFPALNAVALDGSSAPRRLATRYLGSTAAVTSDTIYFDQQELRRNVGLYSDLYALDRRSGRVRPVSSDARLLDPDSAADERTIVCVQDAPGRRDLVMLRLATAAGHPTAATATTARAPAADGTTDTGQTITTLLSDADTQYNAPRFSPDGRLIAVERHRRGFDTEIVLVDVETRAVRVIASRAGTRFVTPAWRRDGRAIVAAASAGDDAPFNLIEMPIDGGPPRQITHTTGGATWPDVSADGTTLVYVGYTADGFDLFSMPYPAAPEGDSPAAPMEPAGATTPMATAANRRAPDAPPPGPAGHVDSPRTVSAYRPWPTLKPTSWSPVIERDVDQIRVGAAVAGYDALQYHVYAASASWLVSGPASAITPAAATPDWQLYYAYNRWRPILWVSASTQTSFFAGPATDSGAPSSATDREREIEAGVTVPISHVRTSYTALASLIRAVDDFSLPGAAITRDRTAVRAGWATTTAHQYGYSISPEQGVTAGITAELVRRALGAFSDATTITADARLYLPSFARHHVIAIRAAAGASTGSPASERTFLLGGGGPNPSVLDFGRSSASLLRGFAADTFAGSHVAVLNADYRWPIAFPQRGVGTWPLFLQTIHAAVFADAGHAWTRTFRAGDLESDVGAEISTDVVAGYFLPLTLTAGGAWGHDGSRSVADGATFYVRIGRAF